MLLGRELKRLREARGMTQQTLAAKAGVTRAYIAQLEAGIRANPSLDVLRRIAKNLKVNPATLVGRG